MIDEEEDFDFDAFSDYCHSDQDLLEKGYDVATFNYECKIYNEMERGIVWPQ